jgi:hypothetical protein
MTDPTKKAPAKAKAPVKKATPRQKAQLGREAAERRASVKSAPKPAPTTMAKATTPKVPEVSVVRKAALAAIETARKPKAEKATPMIPKGYEVKWPHGGYDLYRKVDKSVDGPAWIVACTAHGTTTEAESAKAGDLLGRKDARGAWCGACKSAA